MNRPYNNTAAVLITMDVKERVIGPILKDQPGVTITVAMGVNTDQFGTFSRDIGRSGSQLDAARAKIAAVLITRFFNRWHRKRGLLGTESLYSFPGVGLG